MKKYRVMLVDDEEEVRSAIARKLDWHSLGFEVVGEAGNGEEALELCEQLSPDVIMTDIKMPFMDGLTLCRRAKQLLPGVKVAIFSGFDEFEYAQEAIKLEVEEYILKPIDAEELAGVFRRLRAALDEEIALSRDMQRLQRYYEESLPLMRQQLMTDLLEGRIEADQIQPRFEEYGMQLPAAQYCIAILRIEEDGGLENSRLMPFSLQPLVQDVLGSVLQYRFVQFYGTSALLFLLPEGASVRRVTGRLNSLFAAAKKRLEVKLSIGVGNLYSRPEEIAHSYAEAREALDYQPLVDAGQCVFIGDIEPAAADVQLDTHHGDEIVRSIKIGTSEDVQAAVQGVIQDLRKGPPSREQYQAMMLGLSGELLRLIGAYRLDDAESALTSELLQKATAHFGSIEELGAWLQGFCENLRRAIRHERKDTTRSMVETAHAYLKDHYADSTLSVDTLCSVLNLSPAYFSTLFKKETGESFVACLTRLRMEKALEYLHTTDDKTYMIAEKVGYTDPNYFSYVFKKHYGMSPSKYRQSKVAAHDTTEG